MRYKYRILMLGIIPVSLKILSDVYMYIVVVREFHSQRMQIAFCRDTHVKVSHNTRHDSTVVDRMRTAGHEISWTIGRRTSYWRKRSLICVRSRDNWFRGTSLRRIVLTCVSEIRDLEKRSQKLLAIPCY